MNKWSIAVVALGIIVVLLVLRGGPKVPASPPVALSAPATIPSTATLKISIAVPEGAIPLRGRDTRPLKGQDHPHLHVVFENISAAPQSILDEWNSFGYLNLTIDYTTPDGVKHEIYKNPEMEWSMNFPSMTILAPGQVLVRDVWLDPTIWRDVPKLDSGEERVEMKARFCEHEKRAPQAWQGDIESQPVQIRFTAER
jgi:hypothetical protein